MQTIERYARSTAAVPAQPALHRAALAVGGPGRRGRVERASTNLVRTTTAAARKTYAKMVQQPGRQRRPGAGRRSTSAGLADNTIVVFTSDNGGERFSKTWPFTGKKSELLEGGLRVPDDRALAGRDRAGLGVASRSRSRWTGCRRCSRRRRVRQIRRYPLDGENLLPVLTGERAAASRARCTGATRHGAQRAVRDGDWKYLQIAGNEFLFDVVADPRERANLRTGTRMCSLGSRATGRRGTPRCCRNARAGDPDAPATVRCSPITTACSAPPGRD